MVREHNILKKMEIKAGEQQPENSAGVATDGTGAGDTTPEGVEKEDLTPKSQDELVKELAEKYKDFTPEQLVAEMAKKQEIIYHKNRAIESLKKPKEQAPVTPPKVEEKPIDDLDKPLTRRELLEFNSKSQFESMVNNFTNDAKEREAIINAYQKDIVRSGDVASDFSKALAIANKDVVETFKKNQSISRENENLMAGFSGGFSGNQEAGAPMMDAVKRQTAHNLAKAGFSKEEIEKTLK